MPKIWKVAICKDTSKPMLGLHALHVSFRGLPNVEVVAHVDSNPSDIEIKLRSTRARRHYTDLGEMLEKERPDIVVFCSRHPSDHLPQIRTAAEYGAHIYCEKPLAATLEEVDEIVKIVERTSIKLCMAHPARYDLSFLTMKSMIEAGEIGTPLTVYGRGKCDHRGGGEDMIVLGTHILDYEAFLFGPPSRVWADVRIGGRPISKQDRITTVEPVGSAAGDDIFACFSFPCGVRGLFESKRGLQGIADGVVHMGVTVVGTKGKLSMRFNDRATPVCPLRMSSQPGPPEDPAPWMEVPLIETRSIPRAEPIDYSLAGQPDIPAAHFFLEANRFAVWDLLRAIQEDRQPVSNVFNAATTLEMIHGIYTSSLAKKEIALPLDIRTHPLDT